MISWIAIALLSTQCLLLVAFSFFAFFNYLYGIASLFPAPVQQVTPSGRRVAVVIVAFNEHHVLEDTLKACDALSYPNRVTILADDSDDEAVIDTLREVARARGCKKVENHGFFQELSDEPDAIREPMEIWESDDFVLFHRPKNLGFKGGSLAKVEAYLKSRNIEFMYLLDADWHPPVDVLEQTMGALEADNQAAFVQTKRLSFPTGMNRLQRYVSLIEEGCYYVDFAGRQALGHPTLFSGCCTLFRLRAITDVGGFTPGHLTEDLDLTDRFWLSGWKGIYLGEVVNYGEVPFTYDHFRRQQERWAAGSARAFKEHFRRIVRSNNLTFADKCAAIRQNAYFVTTLLTGIAVLLGIVTVAWLGVSWNSYAVEYYLYLLGTIKGPFVAGVYLCVLSNIIEPVVMVLFKTRRWRDILHLPMMVWCAWSVIPTYVAGNLKGLSGSKMDWFRTPKFNRNKPLAADHASPRVPSPILLIYATVICLYFAQGWLFGWFDEFSLLLVPAAFFGVVATRKNALLH